MSARAHPTGFTYDDYLLFPEDGQRHELIDGEHAVNPAPNLKHQKVALRLAMALQSFVAEKESGEVYIAPVDVILTERDVVQPDLLFVATEHLDRLTERGVRGAPDLVVEITSETSRRMDEVVKRKLYEAHGVAEYWVVDPVVDTVKVYRLADAKLSRVAELSLEEAGVLASPLLPGLEVPLAKLFA
jgi:Uma2 family endonuclease